MTELPRRVCAWCTAILDGGGPLTTTDYITHGMCAQCRDKQMAEINTLIGEVAEARMLAQLAANRITGE